MVDYVGEVVRGRSSLMSRLGGEVVIAVVDVAGCVLTVVVSWLLSVGYWWLGGGCWLVVVCDGW